MNWQAQSVDNLQYFSISFLTIRGRKAGSIWAWKVACTHSIASSPQLKERQEGIDALVWMLGLDGLEGTVKPYLDKTRNAETDAFVHTHTHTCTSESIVTLQFGQMEFWPLLSLLRDLMLWQRRWWSVCRVPGCHVKGEGAFPHFVTVILVPALKGFFFFFLVLSTSLKNKKDSNGSEINYFWNDTCVWFGFFSLVWFQFVLFIWIGCKTGSETL